VRLERGAGYWDDVSVGRGAARPPGLWREHADRINRELCSAWWPAKRPSRVLKTDMFDEASGVGLWPLLVAGAEVAYGVDLSTQTIRSARSRYQGSAATAADVRRLPFADNVFDLVISNSTLDHFERALDIAASLRELRRVLTKGGRLILTLDNPVNPTIALRNALPFALLNRLRVVPYFVGATAGPRKGCELLTEAGFHVFRVGAVLHCPRAPAVAVAWILDRLAVRGLRRAFSRIVLSFEKCGRWPSRFLTGNYVAFGAEKR
jgi:ubiquinone/menaquinone biosynthesis C-methylase UbiE